jgi:heat shock protein HtpX
MAGIIEYNRVHTMNHDLVVKHKFINFIQSTALVLLLSGLMAYVALVVVGELFAWLTFIAVIILFFTNPKIGPPLILRMYDAQRLETAQAPHLHAVLEILTRRAGLKTQPLLYYLPSRLMNAFAVGTADNACIAVSDGMLRKLNLTELAAILAHELSHIKSNDTRVMTFADITGRITKLLAFTGLLLLFVNLPLLLFADYHLNWLPLIIMLFAPHLADLIQLALSRIREYDADLGSAILLGDAKPLASALNKIETYSQNFFSGLFFPMRKIPEPSLMRTHPPTEERTRRLLAFQQQYTLQNEPMLDNTHRQVIYPIHVYPDQPRRPRRHFTGYWY